MYFHFIHKSNKTILYQCTEKYAIGTLSSASIESGNDNDDIFFLDTFAPLATSELDRRRVVFGKSLRICV